MTPFGKPGRRARKRKSLNVPACLLALIGVGLSIFRMNTTPVSILERLGQPENDRAWEQFVQIYTPLLYSWARHLGLQSHDAAELVQDVFLVLIQKLPEFQYDPAKSFRGWLRTV